MDAIQKALELIRTSQNPRDRHKQEAAADFTSTLTDEQAIEVMRLADAEKLSTPRNLAFNYQTQKWRI